LLKRITVVDNVARWNTVDPGLYETFRDSTVALL
jgi:hypothetical protein